MILPNRSDVLPVNMRCTRAAVSQYEVVCRGVQTTIFSVRVLSFSYTDLCR